MKIGNSKLIRSIDNYCINKLGIPSMVLMENAALRVIKNIDFQRFKSFTIVCGTGNNGGDGLVVARQLFSMNMKVNVFIIGEHPMSSDCSVNYNILKNMGICIEHITKDEDIKKLKESLCENDITIDGIFGIGLKRNIEGIYDEVIKVMNRYSTYTLSIDIPSGMMCDSFGILGTCVEANKTVSFEVYKKGFLDYESERYAGEIIIENIGVPEYVVDKFHLKEYLIEINDIKSIIKKRNKYSHKGDFGRVAVIAGSEKYTGAAYLASQGAVKSGAGLVTLCTNKAIVNILQSKMAEAMTMSYEDSGFEKIIDNSDSIAIGPGMGNSETIFNLVKDILSKEGCPVVIDADGLNVLKDNLEILKNSKRQIVITPHMGEMSRLIGVPSKDIIENRIDIAVDFAKKYGVIVLLKGYNTIITNGEEVYVNSTGNSKMASGGMGDTLTGIIASFIGQGYELLKATILSAYIHGYTGDMLSKNMFCVNASHIIEKLPYVIETLVD
ncbi:MAG: NAD(P)H-hydrate dehydratase [Clostridium perfringens]|nr:NAD(P)H-hydrate dehydratase [Clostridium perfringens]